MTNTPTFFYRINIRQSFYKKMGKINYSIQIIKEYNQYFFPIKWYLKIKCTIISSVSFSFDMETFLRKSSMVSNQEFLCIFDIRNYTSLNTR